tara:strand:- start:980 stop:1669 length:690 start_codon:yes stop_codon:yes gene_type:complete
MQRKLSNPIYKIAQEELIEELAQANLDDEKQPIYIINNMGGKSDDKDDIRTINCYGDITERTAGDVVQAMLYFNHTRTESVQGADGKVHEVTRPFKLYISTHGGVVSDMFSILDVMDSIKEDCHIETIGIGKVMSAGVLILANGSKGKRKIGKNCRVMLHSVISGHHGSFPNIENEMRETKELQEMYFDFLCSRTKLTRKKIKKLLLNNVDVYLSAEEAIKYGIADDYL